MKNSLELVVLDMAGTTVNEDNVVYKTIHKVLLADHIECSLEEVLTYCAGKEKRTAIADIIQALHPELHSEKRVDDLFTTFRAALKTAYDELDVQTFEGTADFFQSLRDQGVAIALNTGYDKRTANKLLDKLNWHCGEEYDHLITADDVQNGRPHPDMIHLAMEKSGISDAAHVMKVGDSKIDIEEGHSAKCGYSIGITTGAQTEKELLEANPSFVVNSLGEILSHI